MGSDKAQEAKEKGNQAFKAGDFPVAIGHYSAAIIADRTDATFPLNRAAAYLKLGKNEDAERDCTTVIGLDKKFVKAYFRRGQARVGSGKLLDAQKDFMEAMRLEPSNDAVRAELTKLREQLAKERPKKPATPDVHPQRRRIPIEIVEPPAPVLAPKKTSKFLAERREQGLFHHSNDETFLRAASSRRLEPASRPEPIPVPPAEGVLEKESRPVRSSFGEAKQVRESTKISRTGGGIFRSTGEHTVFGDTPPSTATEKKVEEGSNLSQHKSDARIPKVPVTMKRPMVLFDFKRGWNMAHTVNEKWNLISSIPASSLPTMFKTSLETSLLISILEAFLATLSQNEGDEVLEQEVREYLNELGKVPRLVVVLMLANEGEKAVIDKLWERLGPQHAGVVWGVN